VSTLHVVVVGLGNPGPRYAQTRHNVGFRLVECLAERYSVEMRERRGRRFRFGQAPVDGRRLTLAQPQTFMNASGDVLTSILTAAGGATYADLVVLCDTLDLPPGASRIRLDGSSAGNRGLASILSHAGGQPIRRIYIGVGRPPVGAAVVDHVLRKPNPADAKKIAAAIARICENFGHIMRDDMAAAMNAMNTRGDA
jgi:PTH1 family peptidyl-tRNA hydrolase